MGRKKSKSEIIRKIVDSLSNSNNPKSIYKISNELGSNWKTIKENIKLLQDLEIVDKSNDKYYLDKDLNFDNDAIAGLPIKTDSKKKIYAIAQRVFNKWKEMKNEEPNKTQLQKAVVEISEQIPELNIPEAWYLYGKIVPVNIKPSEFSSELEKVEFGDIEEKLDKIIPETVSKISKFTYSELLDYQYTQHKKEDYQTKLEISKLLSCNNFDYDEFRNLIYKLFFDFPLQEDDEFSQKILSLLKEAGSIIIEKSSELNLKDPLDQQILEDMFKNFWGIYATHSLYVSVKDDLEGDDRLIKKILNGRIEFFAQNLDDIFNYFA